MTEVISRSEASFTFKFDEYINPILPYITDRHLDIGCGTGELSSYLILKKPGIRVTGFDIDHQKINQARFLTRQNLNFTDSVKGLNHSFSSASGIFVFHEAGENIFSTAVQTLSHEALFSIVDYQLKGATQTDFISIFSSQTEVRELAQLGIDSAYRLHTRYNLSDCFAMSQKHGFKTVSHQLISHKYFIWTGQN